jgi:hypothetical protein
MSKRQRVLIFFLVSCLTIAIIIQSGLIGDSKSPSYRGFSGYVTSQEQLENTIGIMEKENLNAYRISFRPSWQSQEGSLKSYNTTYIDYLLNNTDFLVIVDGNHLYPHSEETAQNARDNWQEVQDRIFEIIQRYPNDSRVAIELMNEYAGGDYDNRTQRLIDMVRTAGYTNPIVTNKLYTPWHKFTDSLNNTYQGMHFYFNSYDTDTALGQMQLAFANGITKILNTEVGASFNEYRSFNYGNVKDLETFLLKSESLGISNCIWMNSDSDNWQGYTKYGFWGLTVLDTSIDSATPQPAVIPEQATTNPTLSPTFSPTQNPIPKPFPTAMPTTEPQKNTKFPTNRAFGLSGSLLILVNPKKP